jgi:hypothetical protein
MEPQNLMATVARRCISRGCETISGDFVGLSGGGNIPFLSYTVNRGTSVAIPGRLSVLFPFTSTRSFPSAIEFFPLRHWNKTS